MVAGYSRNAKILTLAADQQAIVALRGVCEPERLQQAPVSKVELPQPKIKACLKGRLLFLAGVAGFEPADRGVKVLCLTAWRYPFVYFHTKRTYFIINMSDCQY